MHCQRGAEGQLIWCGDFRDSPLVLAFRHLEVSIYCVLAGVADNNSLMEVAIAAHTQFLRNHTDTIWTI